MKNVVFIFNGIYEAYLSSSIKQAEKSLQAKAVAAFASGEEAEMFCNMMNNNRNK